MNPLNELTARFWRVNDTVRKLEPSEALLYFYLLKCWQNKRWALPFEHSDEEALKDLSITRNPFKNARKTLAEAGLFVFQTRSGRGNACRYIFPPLKNSLTDESDTLTEAVPNLSKSDSFTGEKVSDSDSFNPASLPDAPEKLSDSDSFTIGKVSESDSFIGEKVSISDSLPPKKVSKSDSFSAEKVSVSDSLTALKMGAAEKEIAEILTVNQLLDRFSEEVAPVSASGAIAGERENISILPDTNFGYLEDSSLSPAGAPAPAPPQAREQVPDLPAGMPRILVMADGKYLTADTLRPYLNGPRGYSKKQIAEFVPAHNGRTFDSKGELTNEVSRWLKARKATQGVFPPGLDLDARKAYFTAQVYAYRDQNPDMYDPDMYEQFLVWYLEHSPGSTRMRIDSETHFEYAKRLSYSNRVHYQPQKAKLARFTTNGQTTSSVKTPHQFELGTALAQQANVGGSVSSWAAGEEDD